VRWSSPTSKPSRPPAASRSKFVLLGALLPLAFFLASRCTFAQSASENQPELVLQNGHVGMVSAIAFSPDGHLIASGSLDSTVKLWDVATGLELRTLSGHTQIIKALVFSPDGRSLASASGDLNVKLWDALTGHEMLTVPTPAGTVENLAFTHNGRWLAFVAGHTFQIYEVSTGRPLRTSTLPLSNFDSGNVAFSADGNLFACTHARTGREAEDLPVREEDQPDRTVSLFEVSTGREIGLLTIGDHMSATSLAFSLDRRWLAVGGRDGVQLWDVKMGKRLRTLPCGRVDAVAFSPNGERLAVKSSDFTVKLLDVKTGRLLSTFDGGPLANHGDTKSAAPTFSPNGRLLTTETAVGSVRVWELKTRRELFSVTSSASEANRVAFSRDGHWLAVANTDKLSLWELAFGQEPLAVTDGGALKGYPDIKSSPDAIAFSPDGRWLAVGSTDGKVRVLDAANWHVQRTLFGHEQSVSAVAFSPDSHWLASGDRDNMVKLWDVESGKDERSLTLGTHPVDGVEGLAFSSDGHWLASASSAAATMWDITSSKAVTAVKASLPRSSGMSYWFQNLIPPFDSDAIRCVSFSPHGSLVAVGSDNNAISLWDVDTQAVARSLTGHRASVSAVAFRSDGLLLASGSLDSSVKLWDVPTGQELRTLSGHSRWVADVAFSTEGRWLASASKDATTRIWDVQTGAERAALISSFDEDRDWLVVSPDGLFDGTADAMQKVTWRNSSDGLAVTPLDSFFTDFYHPGLLSEIISGAAPKSPVDIATVLQVPGLRTMLAQKQAHIETRGSRALVCFEQIPGVAVQVPVGLGSDRPSEINGFRIVPTDHTCTYQKELPTNGSTGDAVTRLHNWKPEVFTTPWDGKSSETAMSTLHVLSVGIAKYPAESGFDSLPYAASSAKAVQDFFAGQNRTAKTTYAQVRVWSGLYDADATRKSIRSRLAEMAKTITEDDVVLLYLAGHGVVVQGQEMFYFVPVDGKEKHIRATGLNTAMLAEALRAMPARRIVLIIDACQSGGAVEALSKIGEVKARVEQQRAQFEARGTPTHEHGVGVHIIAATLPLSYAIGFKTGRSALAATLLDALNEAGSVSAKTVVEYLKKQLPESSKKAINFPQVPLTSSIGLDFALTAN